MSRQVNILFLGGAKRVSFAGYLISAGKRKDTAVNIFSYELTSQVPIASVGTVIIGRRWRDDTVISHLTEVVKKYQIDMILPFVDPAVEIAARLKPMLPQVFVPCCPVEICHTMFDKKRSEKWFLAHDLPIPPSFSPQDEPVFPVILKPRTGSASKGIRIVTDKEAWLSVENRDEYVIQHYITDREEFTVDGYVSSPGTILCVVPRIRLDVAGGEVMNTITVRDRQIIDLSLKVLSCGEFRGPVTIQFIRDKTTGETFIMEINPRLGGGVIAGIAAGADIPAFLIDEQAGRTVSPVTDWRENTLMTRYFKEVIFYADHH